MTKSQTKTVTMILFVCAGVATIVLDKNGYISSDASSLILFILIILSNASYYVVDHFYKTSEAQQDETSTSSQT